MNARFGNGAAAKTILSEISNPSTSLYGFIIKTFGEADRIDDAIDVFQTMLKDQRVIPNIYTFNVLLNACALSKSLGYMVFDRAKELVDILSTNGRCVQLKLRPDKVTYNTLLKCLTKSSSCKEDASALAEAIILEMEERRKSDPKIIPSIITFNLAITVCVQVNDEVRMNEFMNKMEKYNIKTDARICNTILNHYAQTGTSESAERAESFLSSLKRMGKTDESVRPNVYTYNMVLNAWGRSNHPKFAHHMWLIYESMLSDQVRPDEVTYHTMISHLTKSPDSIGLADKLLLESESSRKCNDGRFHPNYNTYSMVIKAWLKFRDAEHATQLLFRWLSLAKVNHATPEKRTEVVGSMTSMYHQLVITWIQLSDVERATSVTEKIYDLYTDASNIQRFMEPPSLQTYILLHKLWDKTNHQSKDIYLTKIKERIDSYQQY